ncbi:uncharacterized protein LOC101847975 [Aplysia californica]|uniref:Uncharacterized protein LOC101847975 n=1 Tax=Aplysia californica TaxID=6500 RepID=A0ABM0JWY0_APLCA|nr:uncharacterized protein LOC101847975 [Aplysia californica]
MNAVILVCALALAGVSALPAQLNNANVEAEDLNLADIIDIVNKLKPVINLLNKRDGLDAIEIEDIHIHLEDVTHGIKKVTGALAGVFGKRDLENQDLDLGSKKDLVDLYNKVLNVISRRDVAPMDVEDFALEKVTGGIHKITHSVASIFGKRDSLPVEFQDTDWHKVGDDVKGIGKDLVKIIPGAISIASLFGKRDTLPVEVEDTNWHKVGDDVKGIGKDLVTIIPGAVSIAKLFGKREAEIEDFDLGKVIKEVKTGLTVLKLFGRDVEEQDFDLGKVISKVKTGLAVLKLLG